MVSRGKDKEGSRVSRDGGGKGHWVPLDCNFRFIGEQGDIGPVPIYDIPRSKNRVIKIISSDGENRSGNALVKSLRNFTALSLLSCRIAQLLSSRTSPLFGPSY